MTFLLDTHVLLWLAEGSPDLAESWRDRMDQAAQQDGLAVSSISFWEISMLAARHRISLSLPVSAWRDLVLDSAGISELAVTGDIGIESVFLPGRLHEDPADRLLIATARLHGLHLLTRDQRILDYGAAGHVNVLRV